MKIETLQNSCVSHTLALYILACLCPETRKVASLVKTIVSKNAVSLFVLALA